MSEKQKNDAIHEHVKIGNFFRSEYIKRHVEEYDTPSLELIEKIRTELCSCGYSHEDFFIGFSYVLEEYQSYKNNIKHEKCKELLNLLNYYTPFLDFKNSPYTKHFEDLYNISIKYNIRATKLLYPTDMNTVLQEINNEKFSPIIEYPFIEKYNPTLQTITNDGEPYLVYKINDDTDPKTPERIQLDLTIARLNHGKELSGSEISNLRNLSANDAVSDFRTSSVMSRSLGLLMWDKNKRNRRPAGDYVDLYREYKCKKPNCDTHCEDEDKCQRELRDAYKVASKSIKSGRIEPTNIKGNANNPNSKYNLKRYEIHWPQSD